MDRRTHGRMHRRTDAQDFYVPPNGFTMAGDKNKIACYTLFMVISETSVVCQFRNSSSTCTCGKVILVPLVGGGGGVGYCLYGPLQVYSAVLTPLFNPNLILLTTIIVGFRFWTPFLYNLVFSSLFSLDFNYFVSHFKNNFIFFVVPFLSLLPSIST